MQAHCLAIAWILEGSESSKHSTCIGTHYSLHSSLELVWTYCLSPQICRSYSVSQEFDLYQLHQLFPLSSGFQLSLTNRKIRGQKRRLESFDSILVESPQFCFILFEKPQFLSSRPLPQLQMLPLGSINHLFYLSLTKPKGGNGSPALLVLGQPTPHWFPLTL